VKHRPLAGEVGGRGVPRVRRLALAVLPLLLAGLASGCATKRDIRDMRSDLRRLESRQDSIFRLLQLQNRQILDSLQVTTEQLLNVRGELANQLSTLQEQLVQVGELTGQVQIRLNQLDQQLAGAVQNVSDSGLAGEPPPGGGGGEAGGSESAREFYDIAVEQLDRGNAETARRAFQMVLDSFPNDPLAPEAQRQIGETYVLERAYDDALQAFERVVQRYQDSPAAPLALYRRGSISSE
jgi:TolA-binding protein